MPGIPADLSQSRSGHTRSLLLSPPGMSRILVCSPLRNPPHPFLPTINFFAAREILFSFDLDGSGDGPSKTPTEHAVQFRCFWADSLRTGLACVVDLFWIPVIEGNIKSKPQFFFLRTSEPISSSSLSLSLSLSLFSRLAHRCPAMSS